MSSALISSVRCSTPPGWVIWPAGDGQAAADDLVATDAAPTSHALAAAVVSFDADTLAGHEGTMLAGLWRPDVVAAPMASMRILVTSPTSPRMTPDELLAFAWEPPSDAQVLDIAADPGHLAAGPAVAQIVRGVRRPDRSGGLMARLLSGSSRQVITHLTWYVLPSGTDQVVACRFETANPYLLEELGMQTNLITDSLVVDLEAP